MNKKTKILILFLYLGLILIFLICLKNHIPCLFKTIFKLPCPACGTTRAIKEILHFNIIKSFSYNILTFALIITLLILLLFNIIDIIFNKQYLTKIIKKLINHYYIIIILLILSWIINIYRNI